LRSAGVEFGLAPDTSSAHNAMMADAPKFRIDVAAAADRPGRYRWRIFEDLKLRDTSLHSFATKREAQIDADKFVARLNDIWKAHDEQDPQTPAGLKKPPQ
jgi:hypothetical protein